MHAITTEWTSAFSRSSCVTRRASMKQGEGEACLLGSCYTAQTGQSHDDVGGEKRILRRPPSSRLGDVSDISTSSHAKRNVVGCICISILSATPELLKSCSWWCKSSPRHPHAAVEKFQLRVVFQILLLLLCSYCPLFDDANRCLYCDHTKSRQPHCF